MTDMFVYYIQSPTTRRVYYTVQAHSLHTTVSEWVRKRQIKRMRLYRAFYHAVQSTGRYQGASAKHQCLGWWHIVC